jgi:uncharacterized protein (TIGR03032 family)
VFVKPRYSCLAALDPTHSFRPIWKPSFIPNLAGEDRCHLNGLAMHEGAPKYVTAVSRTDLLSGWRERRHEGGVLMEVGTNRIVTDQLSMPHSPRVAPEGVYALHSGRGQLIRIDPATGAKTDIAFWPASCAGWRLITATPSPDQRAFRCRGTSGRRLPRVAWPWHQRDSEHDQIRSGDWIGLPV